MIEEIFKRIQLQESIRKQLSELRESKSWGEIASALYGILDDINLDDNECKKYSRMFRTKIGELHSKKNQFIQKRVDEKVDWRICDKCYYFKSFRDVYDDEFEPIDIGFCQHPCAGLHKVVEAKDECTVLDKEGWEWEKKYKLKEGTVDHARRELELAGMFDKEVDGSEAAGSWNKLCANAVIELMEVFAKQGHSGMSASMTRELFKKLSNFETLTELTDDPDEWTNVSEHGGSDGKSLWQSSRNPSCMSSDGGKTYWDINEDYYISEDENGDSWFGGLSDEAWKNRPMHTSKHIEKENE